MDREIGLRALERIWTDGVNRIVSWFVVHRGTIYEVLWSQPLIPSDGSAPYGTVGEALCANGISFV